MHMSWHVATHHWMLASLLLRYVLRRDTHTGYVVVQGYLYSLQYVPMHVAVDVLAVCGCCITCRGMLLLNTSAGAS